MATLGGGFGTVRGPVRVSWGEGGPRISGGLELGLAIFPPRRVILLVVSRHLQTGQTKWLPCSRPAAHAAPCACVRAQLKLGAHSKNLAPTTNRKTLLEALEPLLHAQRKWFTPWPYDFMLVANHAVPSTRVTYSLTNGKWAV